MASTYLQQGFSRGRGFPELPSGLGHNLLLPPLPAPSLSSGTSHQAAPSGALESHFQSPAPKAGLELENSAEEKQQVGWEFGVGDASGRGLPESAAEERAVPRGLGIPASLTLPGSSRSIGYRSQLRCPSLIPKFHFQFPLRGLNRRKRVEQGEGGDGAGTARKEVRGARSHCQPGASGGNCSPATVLSTAFSLRPPRLISQHVTYRIPISCHGHWSSAHTWEHLEEEIWMERNESTSACYSQEWIPSHKTGSSLKSGV